MKLRKLFLRVFVVVLLISCAFAKKSSGGSRGSSSSSSSRRNSKTTSRPHTHTQTESRGPGWNVPDHSNSRPVGTPPPYSKYPASSTNYHQQSSNPSYNPPQTNKYQPSAPVDSGHYNTNNNPNRYNTHSSYPTQPPSNGYHAPPAYNAQPAYNAPPAYHAPAYHAPPAYQPYNPYHGHSSVPGAGYNPPVGHAPTTVYVQQGGSSGRPGIGQLAKEAFVYAGVSAGVNAAVNRILPGGISGHRHDTYYPPPQVASNGVVPTVTNTHIINNYYNNGTSVPAGEPAVQSAGQPAAQVNQPAVQPAIQPAIQPAQASAPPSVPSNDPTPAVVPIGAPENINNSQNSPPPAPPAPVFDENTFPSPSGANVTKTEVLQFTEDLFTNDKNNAYKYITMNLQGQKTDDSTKDDAPEPLLVVKDEAYEIPTIRNVVALHDSFALDVKAKEIQSPEKYKKINDLLESFIETDVMKKTMTFLSDKGFLPAGTQEYEFKDTLRGIWFALFKRTEGEAGSSGFETIFLAEKFDSEIIGMHNWIYYAKQEASKNMNYLGYIKETKLGTNGAIVKLRSSLNDVIQPVSSIFVGTSPELEMALYTMCFYVRPNVPCPIKLGGNEFIIISNAINYYGRDILISGFPEI